jgi:hypothetical protein
MMTIRINPDSGESYDLVVGSRDIVVWEKIDRNNNMARLEADPRMSDMYSVSHIAARRQGKFVGTLAEWETSVDLDLDVNGADSTPTQPGQ